MMLFADGVLPEGFPLPPSCTAPVRCPEKGPERVTASDAVQRRTPRADSPGPTGLGLADEAPTADRWRAGRTARQQLKLSPGVVPRICTKLL